MKIKRNGYKAPFVPLFLSTGRKREKEKSKHKALFAPNLTFPFSL